MGCYGWIFFCLESALACCRCGARCTHKAKSSESLDASLNYYEVIQVNRRIEKRGAVATTSPYSRQERLTFNAFNRRFDMYLTPKRGLLHSRFVGRLVDADGNERPLPVDPDEHFEGHVHGAKDSIVSLTFDDEGAILGSVHVDGETFGFEPARLHQASYKTGEVIAYRTSDMKFNFTMSDGRYCGSSGRRTNPILEASQKRPKRSGYAIHKNRLCPLRIVADHLFFNAIGNGSAAFSARYLINVIDRVNVLYTTTEWGEDGQGGRLVNMGFMIKEMIVHNTPTRADPDHYNAVFSGKRNVNQLLDSFSRRQGSDKYCLVHLFTAQSFENGVLGLGYISSPELHSAGGICSPLSHTSSGDVYYNTALSSAKTTQGGTVITREADIVTAHELGHNWGATHDDSSAECSPPYSAGGSYIMNTYSVSGYDTNNNRFSPCSRRMVAKVLSRKADICFEEETSSFCGNGRVEEGEECDVGKLLTGHEDNCCTSWCRLRPGAQCSPKNVPCCSSGCQFLPSTHLCLHENPLQCKHSSYCTGKSGECPEPPAIDDGRECLEEGECLNGRCLTFCERPAINKKPCICPNAADSCLRCCRSSNGTCEPFARSHKYILRNGTRCIHGYCRNVLCIKEVADVVSHFWHIIENIDETNFWKFVEDNLIGLVLSVTLLFWIPISVLVHSIDSARAKRSVQEGNRLVRVIA
ncbi:ADAM 17-like protease [Toxocara canis]|uniref:ADAM 17-like protease n=1 Tax=Toxocara canis TaxID=6265 RepID=A0A0B2V0Y3_TOXCA|nr:ADAM 17-like protease [Toxocara canis]